MKTTRLSLLLAGFVSVAAPTATALPESHEAALEGAVGTWTPHASMSIARAGHTATLINSTGNVLVTSQGSAEVYNPYDEVWRPTAPMLNAVRDNASATWIQATGQVLVAGGRGQYDANLQSAELYDPATNTWTATGNMITARSRHTATMLDSGKILVAGGSFTRWETSYAELYDPATGTWSATANMNIPRATHTATKLYSGKVLVVGGFFFPYGDHDTAEIYDPDTGTWTRAGMMTRTRREHVAIRLFSGKVLVTGGGAYGDNSVELYDPYNDLWTVGPSLPFALGSSRNLSATMLYTGEVLVMDGGTGQAALYDESTQSWLPVSQRQARRGHTATLLHMGQILVTGGVDGTTNTALSSTEQFTR
jgi:hypothetical protein